MPDPDTNITQPLLQANMVIRNIGQLVTVAQQPVPGASGPLQMLQNAALAVLNGRIVRIGADDDAEPMFQRDTTIILMALPLLMRKEPLSHPA